MKTQPEFSYFVDCTTIKEADKTYEIAANEEERAALAKRFDLLSLDSLKAKALVSRESGDLVQLRCDVSADITQQCTVTLKPLNTKIISTFERTFSATAEPYLGSEKEPEGEGEYEHPGSDEMAPEPPDPMIDGGFDLGETVAEQVLLEIDPFPRSPDANFDGFSSSGDDEDEGGKTNPFSVLEQLKKK